jgi:hypothetical protein
LCYSSRGSPDKTDQGCNPLDGNPFNSFWTHIGVKEFANGSVFHSPLLTDYKYAKEWKTRFRDIKVLAFVGMKSMSTVEPPIHTNFACVHIQGLHQPFPLTRKRSKSRNISLYPQESPQTVINIVRLVVLRGSHILRFI